MKFCKDCKHIKLDPSWYMGKAWRIKFACCTARNWRDPVTGKANHYCDIEREFGVYCGPEGKLWEPKQ